MGASLISVDDNTATIEIKVNLTDSMLGSEQAILNAVNDAGNLATKVALEHFDTDGSDLIIGKTILYSKGKVPKKYQTPYGEIQIQRHTYQDFKGGKTFCPLEKDARIVLTSTPRFAKIISNKTANNATPKVQCDLEDNHGRSIARTFLRDTANVVGAVAQAKEEDWHYHVPKLNEEVATIAIGLDGTCMLLCDDGYRETMAGTFSLYDKKGNRMHTIYLGAPPEYGKSVFHKRMDIEIFNLKLLYPNARFIGVADGAQDNWDYLAPYISRQILDFYHATSYLKGASEAVFPRSKANQTKWLDEKCHQLKHERGAAKSILQDLKQLNIKVLGKTVKEKLQATITYFRNHLHQMNYKQYRVDKLPIGSGVTEAACKTLIKQRLCNSGMKWKNKGAGVIISLRSLVLTKKRWNQFWDKINQYGFPELTV